MEANDREEIISKFFNWQTYQRIHELFKYIFISFKLLLVKNWATKCVENVAKGGIFRMVYDPIIACRSFYYF